MRRVDVRRRIAVHREALEVVGHSATRSGCRSADSIADDAVWPSPQIDASRIDLPDIAQQGQLLVARRERCDPPASRARSSSWRTLPTRHGTHWPHDSSRKNRAMRTSVSTRSTVSSKTMITPEPRVAPAARVASKVSGRSSCVRPDEDARRAAEQDRLDVPAARHAAGELDQVAQRRAELDLVGARPRDVAGQAEQLRPGRALRADRGVRLAAHPRMQRDVGQRLDVVDDRRLAEQADLDRERRLVARLAALALDRFEERRLLAADVGAGAAPELDVEARSPEPRMSSPEQARVPGPPRGPPPDAPRPPGTRRAGRGSPGSPRSRSRRSSSPR